MSDHKKPVISLCYTSVRPGEVQRVVDQWTLRASDMAKLEWVMCHDAGDDNTRDAMLEASSGLHRALVVANTGPKNCVAGWNAAAAASTGQILISVSDDFNCLKGWDTKLAAVAQEGWWKQPRVVATNDLYVPDVFTLTIITRARYQEFGYMFYGRYESLFSDTEATAVAIADEVVIDARWLVFEHMHPDCGKRQRDDTDLNHASKARWERGELLFNYRKAVGFPLDSGPVAESRAGKPIRYAAVVQAIQDDFCLYETLKRLIDESAALPHGDGLDKIFLFMPTKRWDGTVAAQGGHDEVVRVASRLSDRHPGVIEVVKVNVDAVSRWDQPRIMVETDCRNFYSEFCRQRGFEHLLIVDGDELWRAGLMAKLGQFIRDRGWPKSVFTGMIPVAGLPGYPVEGAMDKATIYTRSNIHFKECRGAVGYRHSLPGFDIYHFTATRRTMQEIADKHRNSGHKDDARYQMERWIQEVLLPGKIKPGLRNSHMYDLFGDANVWPMIRPWSPEEWAELPETVKPFLSNAR